MARNDRSTATAPSKPTEPEPTEPQPVSDTEPQPVSDTEPQPVPSDEQGSDEPNTDGNTDTKPTEPQPSPAETFAALWAATTTSDSAPALSDDDRDAVLSAWRAIDTKHRGDAVATATAQTMATAMAASPPNTDAMAVAMLLRAAIDAAEQAGDLSADTAAARVNAVRMLLALTVADVQRRGLPVPAALSPTDDGYTEPSTDGLAALWSDGFGGKPPTLSGKRASNRSASGTEPSGDRAPTGSVAAWIVSTLNALSDGSAVSYTDGKPSEPDSDGFYTVAQLRRSRAASESHYTDGPPSPGAVVAALNRTVPDGVAYQSKPDRVRLSA